jgi:murein L,D-transpeptidase YafK
MLVVAVALLVAPSAWEFLTFDELAPDVSADRLVINKANRSLTVYANDQPVKLYRVSLGREPVGPKEIEGDGRTPEGQYTIDWRKADSQFHRALHVSYPTPEQEARADELGHDPGGQIMIHGIRNGLGLIGPAHRLFDWTDGCIAVSNREIEELWRVVPDGTPLKIEP